MAEDVKAAMGKMSRVLRMAKDRANTQFGKVKERAKRLSLSGSQTASHATSQSAPDAEDTESKVKQLMDLGFSEAASRQALRASGGQLEAAGLWLLDERNADEVLAAEVAAQEARPALQVGGRARVAGLQTAAALNGSSVLLQKWDEATHRWIVSMPDGSVKSIRAENLDPVYASQPEQPGPVQSSRASEPAADASAAARSDLVDREELEAVARTMLSSSGQPAADEVLAALSEVDLLELINGLSQDHFTRAEQAQDDENVGTQAPQAQQDPSDDQDLQAEGAQQASGRPEERQSSTVRHPDIASKRFELELEEARLQSLAEAQAKRAEELEAREAALREAEDALERRRSQEPKPEEAQAPVSVRIPFVLPEVSEAASPTSTSLEAERAELQRLREEVETAAKELEVRQEAAKRSAEERELQLLEEESAQMKLASSLKEEEARLHMQRRSLGMLQQAMLKAKGAATSSSGGYVEHTMNDESEPNEPGETEAGQPKDHDEGFQPQAKDEDEVWDLDWSAVQPEGGRPSEPDKESACFTQR